MVVHNPNWPLIDEAISWQSGPNSAAPFPYWCSIVERSKGQWASTRGRQYEIDQVQTGQVTTTVQNSDGAFDPDNTASPFYPEVVPYRGYRRRAQYPATINILTADQASAGAASGLAAGTLPPWTSTSTYPMSLTAAHVYSVTLPTTPVSGTVLLSLMGWSVLPSTSFAARATVTASTSTSLKLALVWINASGGTISTTTGTAVAVTTSTTVTVVGTAPANAVGAVLQLVLNSSPASASTVTAVNFQLERNASASAYVQPGTWYSLFTGFVERYPQTWEMNGTYGTSQLTAVDAFGFLSQRSLRSPAYQEALAMGPDFLYPLDEPAGSASFADLSAQRQALQVFTQGTQAGETSGVSLANPGTALGIGGPVVTFANTIPGVGTGPQTTLANPVVGPPAGAFTRVIAIRMPTPPSMTTSQFVWAANNPDNSSTVGLYIDGITAVPVYDLSGGLGIFGAYSIADGNWHLIGFSLSADGKTQKLNVDTNYANASFTSASAHYPSYLVGATDLIGGISYGATPELGFSGDVAFAAEFPFEMTQAQWTRLVETFAYGGSIPATSATRYADILRWAQWNGQSNIDSYATGDTNEYGPAVEFIATAADSGTDTVSGLQTVVDTANGSHFVDRDGEPTFQSRRARYNQTTPAVTFGEKDTALGESPYLDVTFGLDPTRLVTDVTLTQTSTNKPTRILDATAVSTFGDITLQRNVNSLDPYEITDAATFLVNRFKVPMKRVETLTVNVGARPTSWSTMLSLEIGMRVRVMRRPYKSAAGITPAVIQFEGFIEAINWTIDDIGNATVDLQVSPAVGLQFWQVASSHVTLHTAVAANGTTMVINPLPDAATNPVQANIDPDISPRWVIDWGTASAEYLTISAVTPGATGYSTATLSVGTCVDVATGASGTGFRHAHSVGAVIQDIGYIVQEPGNSSAAAQLGNWLTPPSALDAFSTVGSTTIAGY